MDKSAFGPRPSPAIQADPVLVTPAPAIKSSPLFPISDPRLAELVAKWGMLSDDQRKEVLRVGDPWAMPAAPIAIDVLRRVEWAGVCDGWACCPLCEGNTTVGHTTDCDLATVLRANGRAL